MVLIIVDVFKIVFMNYEKGKFDERYRGLCFVQYDNKEFN